MRPRSSSSTSDRGHPGAPRAAAAVARPRIGGPAREIVVVLLACAAAFIPAFLIFPPLSDADFAVFDGISYAWHAENPDAPLAREAGMNVNPNHLGFHLAVTALVPVLRAAGVEAPGFAACRLLSALGLASVILLLVNMAGPGRRWCALPILVLLLACRGVVLEGAVGDTNLPAAAAALALARAVGRASPRRGVCCALLVLALVLREDNVLMVPGVLVAYAAAFPAGARRREAAVLAGIAGAIVIAVYLAAWKSHPLDLTLRDYMLGIAGGGDWSAARKFGLPAWHLETQAFSTAIAGRTTAMEVLSLWPAGVFLAALAAVAVLLRGGAPLARLAALVILTLLARILFFLWFDPSNWEWWLLPLVLLAGIAARAVSGPRGASGRRLVGALAVSVVCAAALLARHASATLDLSRRSLHDAVGRALDATGPGTTVLSLGRRLALDLVVRGVPFTDLPDQAALPWPRDAEATARRFLDVLPQSAEPAILLIDRFVRDGAIHTRAVPGPFRFLDDREFDARWTVLRDDRGRVYGLGVRLARER